MPKLSFLPKKIRTGLIRIIRRGVLLFRAISWQLRPPLVAALEPSMLVPADCNLGPGPTPALLRDVLGWLTCAHERTLDGLAPRVSVAQLAQLNFWPGEHYRLLSAIVEQRQARLVVEIGTYTGLSALAIRQGMPATGKLVTYDLCPWDSFSDTALIRGDFGPQLEQRLGNLADEAYFLSQLDIMQAADVFFLDAPKDGKFEPAFFRLFLTHRVKPALLVFDDIRLLTMLELWHQIPYPKIDLTGLGHWTGTGVVEFSRAGPPDVARAACKA